VTPGQVADLVRIDRRLCFEVEARKLLHGREVCKLPRHLDAAVILALILLCKSEIARLTRRQVRARRLIEQVVELVADAGELQSRQRRVERIGRCLGCFLCARNQKFPPIAASYSARGRNNEGGGDDAGAVDAAISTGNTVEAGGRRPRRRPSDCLWTATSRTPWRMRTSPAATVTATRSPISRHGTE
jgi:hypothetical protein